METFRTDNRHWTAFQVNKLTEVEKILDDLLRTAEQLITVQCAREHDLAVVAAPLGAIEPRGPGLFQTRYSPDVFALLDHLCNFIDVRHIKPAIRRKGQRSHTARVLRAGVYRPISAHTGPNSHQLALPRAGEFLCRVQGSYIVKQPTRKIPGSPASTLTAACSYRESTVRKTFWQPSGKLLPISLIAAHPRKVNHGQCRWASQWRSSSEKP